MCSLPDFAGGGGLGKGKGKGVWSVEKGASSCDSFDSRYCSMWLLQTFCPTTEITLISFSVCINNEAPSHTPLPPFGAFACA